VVMAKYIRQCTFCENLTHIDDIEKWGYAQVCNDCRLKRDKDDQNRVADKDSERGQ